MIKRQLDKKGGEEGEKGRRKDKIKGRIVFCIRMLASQLMIASQKKTLVCRFPRIESVIFCCFLFLCFLFPLTVRLCWT